MYREKLRDNNNDHAEVSREHAGRGERWKDIIDRVASRTLGGHTHTSCCNRLHTSRAFMTPTTHTLHSGHTFTTHYALCYALLPISLALQFTTEYLHCTCHWGWTEIIWRETSMCFFVFCLLRLTLQRRKSCSSVVDHLCSLVLYFSVDIHKQKTKPNLLLKVTNRDI